MAESDHQRPIESGKAKGGRARAESMTGEQRTELARKAASARWSKSGAMPVTAVPKLPTASYRGVLPLGGIELPCYVLDTGERLIGRTSFTELLSGVPGGGGLEKYLGVGPLKPFLNMDLVLERMRAFNLPEVAGLERDVKGLPTDLVIDICRAFVSALEANIADPKAHPMTKRQAEMAIKAGMVLSASAKVGLDALVDEATGYQYERAEDALRVKLKAYLEDEMRKWEPTFPNELWVEFARLTNWRGTVTKRPKYWGKLVMELVYHYLDKDVARWLKENAPAPRHGQNYHQWLSAQFGLKKLVEHIWTLIGVARTCETMFELREKMAALNGRTMVQLFLPVPNAPRAGTSTDNV
jgi:hypothetical protein